MKYTDWTVDDEFIANHQGWTLAKDIHGVTIERLPSTGVFLDYGEAWLHVYNNFLIGDKVCKKALTIIAEENRTEFLRIKEEGELANIENKIS